MKIEKLSNYSLKITLYEKDISYYKINYADWNSINATEFLLMISDEIKQKTGSDITKEKVYVEIFSRINKCLIFISFPSVPKHKNEKKTILCCFNDYEQLKNFCCIINEVLPHAVSDSSLYIYKSVLWLKIETESLYINHFRQYSEKITETNEFSDSVINEHFTSVLQKNAVKEISVS